MTSKNYTELCAYALSTLEKLYHDEIVCQVHRYDTEHKIAAGVLSPNDVMTIMAVARQYGALCALKAHVEACDTCQHTDAGLRVSRVSRVCLLRPRLEQEAKL